MQWRIQDFPQGGRQPPKLLLFFTFLPKTAWKWKNLDPQGGRASLAPPLGSANAVCWWLSCWKAISSGCFVDFSSCYWRKLRGRSKTSSWNYLQPLIRTSYCTGTFSQAWIYTRCPYGGSRPEPSLYPSRGKAWPSTARQEPVPKTEPWIPTVVVVSSVTYE